MKGLSLDSFFDGRLKINQEIAGYRFSIDAVILAAHVKTQPGETIVDLGTGCGIIPLILAYREPALKLVGVELQETLAEIALQNVAANGMADRIAIVCRDMKAFGKSDLSGPADVVVTNPPFRKVRTGRLNPDAQRAIARHEIKVTLADVIETAHRLLKPSGRFITIYPAERLTDLLSTMRATAIEPKLLRVIYPRRGKEANRVLVEGVKRAPVGLTVANPLVIYRSDGSYTAETQRLLQP